MLRVEEYIVKRKIEDGLNEFSYRDRMGNLKQCINYLFEYFNNYLEQEGADKKTVGEIEKINRYQNQIQKYSTELESWLLDQYDTHGNQVDRIISNVVRKEELFMLYYEEKEYRELSYRCYSEVIKKYKYLSYESEFIYKFIKEYQKTEGERNTRFYENRDFGEKVTEWLSETERKYGVSIIAFANDYINIFYSNTAMWPSKHKKASKEFLLEYDYDYKAKKNLFGIDALYIKIKNRPFIRGHKQELEFMLLFMYLANIEPDEEYWHEYMTSYYNHNNKKQM